MLREETEGKGMGGADGCLKFGRVPDSDQIYGLLQGERNEVPVTTMLWKSAAMGRWNG